jgi:5-(carboxyamino)imidazole ribonucleotide synthase
VTNLDKDFIGGDALGSKALDGDYLNIHIGIIGGGQLGKMMIEEAKKLSFHITILDPTPDCPAHSISDEHIVADFNDRGAIERLVQKCDVVTYEFEHIDAEVLTRLENEGHKIYPTAKSLSIIQNKFLQKQLLKQDGLPVPDFMQITSIEDMKKAGEEYGYPYMLKACTGGYDGKGNALVKDENSVAEAYLQLGNGTIPLMAERLVDFCMETSVLACRGLNGDIVVYPVGDNRHRNSILHETVVPADITEAASKKAMSVAKRVMEVFDGIGMFCVEMFITKDMDVLVNEVAPRPHNSGHYTIEGCVTSQFANHIRAITGLPLGSTDLLSPTVMINLLGAEGYEGDAFVKGLYDALKIKNTHVHIYGKKTTKPNRKMGHITVVAPSTKEAIASAEDAYKCISVISK